MSTPKRGRPIGAIQTPASVLRQDMREAARLNREMRELLTVQLKKIKEALQDPTTDLATRLAVLEALTACLSGSARAMDSTAKHIIGAEGQEEEEVVDPLKELRGR